jgi:hypothetical protein
MLPLWYISFALADWGNGLPKKKYEKRIQTARGIKKQSKKGL